MAQIALTEDEEARIESILDELDPLNHELVLPARDPLSAEEWGFVVDHIRQKIRSALELGFMARALACTAERRGLSDDRGADHFLRSKAWVHNFGVAQTGDEYFCALSLKSGNRLLKAADALVEFAQDRVFDTFDDEYRRVFPSDR